MKLIVERDGEYFLVTGPGGADFHTIFRSLNEDFGELGHFIWLKIKTLEEYNERDGLVPLRINAGSGKGD